MPSIAKSFTAGLLLAGSGLATEYYVDCSQNSAGTGTSDSPWHSLDQANTPTFQAGDIISFRTGTICTGTFAPKGSGTSDSVIQITKYSTDSTAARPIISAAGATAAVSLTNQDHWLISDIEVTNPATSVDRRQGIHATASDGKTHTGITIKSTFVHDVAGQTNKATHSDDFIASAGILVDADIETTSRYDDVLVEGNEVSDCGGGGIKVRVGTMDNRGYSTHVTKNIIDACGGDGIIISYGEGPLIDYNVASNLGTGAYPYTGGNFAGMWVLGANDPTISHNVVYGSIMSVADSQAFDCDWGNEGNCTIEYNYSHDNAGGAFLNCDGCGPSGGADQIVRYNIFQNDCRISSNGDIPTLYFYQNIVYCPDTAFDITIAADAHFTNNIFVGNSNSTLPSGSGINWEWNVFHNVDNPGNNGILGDPGFVNPGTGKDSLDSVDGYRLEDTSPALANGAVIPGNGGRDFYGNAVSASEKPNRGVYEGPGISS